MKGKRRFGGKQQKNNLHKLMLSVNGFVERQAGHGDTERYERMASFAKKKSRKEKRREKKKARKARLRNPTSSEKPDPPEKSLHKQKADKPNSPEAQPAPERAPEGKPKKRVRFDDSVPPQTKKAKLDIARRRTLLEANQAEDKEIKKLEKRLGLNKRKNKRSLPQSFVDDGLDYILGILEPGASEALQEDGKEDMEAGMVKSELQRLKELSDTEEEEGEDAEKANEDDEQEQEDEEREMNEDDEEDEESDMNEDDEVEDEDDQEDEEEEGVPEDGHVKSDEEDKSSNPEQSSSAIGKYVPPHLREAEDSKRKAELEKLKRNLKGLINRLSESNMGSISGQIEELYMSCSRKDVNDTLTELLLAACVAPTLLPDRLLMEHILLLSVLHHTVGLEVGAHLLETVVRRFDETYRQSSDTGKECDNLACMIAHLYNFHVVHSLLLFDLLKQLVASFSARDVELVLLLLRNVGFALRKDDPLALKELITEAQRKASAEGQRFSDQTRVRFMLDTMLALKNNDVRKIPGYDPEPMERLRKLQRTLVHHRASGTDVRLRVSLENLLEAERVGRWWIVGSSWSGAPMIDNKRTSKPVKGEQFSATVLELARKQRMNTDVRKNIFCVIMTSEDFLDAFEKLLRLGLKGQQERDIVHVLLDCCLQEKSFNGFYAVLAEKFCAHDRRFQMMFQFCLWDKFKDLGSMSNCSFSNLVQMVTQLLHKNSLSLSILKAIEFGELDKPKVKFLRQVLSKLLQKTEPEDLTQIFGRISGNQKLAVLREGLKLFIRHFLLRSSQTPGTDEQTSLLTERAEIACKAMEAREAKLQL